MTIGFQVSGYGPTRLLLLHGWLSDRCVFDTVLPWFDEAQFTIARMDYRGYGLSRHLKGNHTIDEIAGDALQLAKKLGWEKFHVLGHSMGGMVLQKMALLAPGAILSGVATTPVAASGFEMDADTRGFFQSAADDDVALTEIFNILTGQRHSKQFLQSLTMAARQSTTREAFLGYLDAWAQSNFADQVKDISVPILVIAGACDGALGPEVMKETYLKQLADAELKVIEGAGHYPMLETPAEYFTIVESNFA